MGSGSNSRNHLCSRRRTSVQPIGSPAGLHSGTGTTHGGVLPDGAEVEGPAVIPTCGDNLLLQVVLMDTS
jgi:hypothetical protein